ncbi:S-adenosyl-L-methionine-dependent methyltransferase [Lyophyllum atratum]|nr:S-adenosyl-L-methionine-dependent methyltransferase [Lyophyllum atratum]
MATQATADGFSEANKTHFNATAHEYDDIPHALERARRTAARMRESYTFDEDATTVMEYACGTGLVSRELAPYAKRIVGVDISQGMVDQFNLRVSNQGIASEEMQALCVELKGVPGELGDEKFDVIVCASAYHHFTSIDDVTRILAYFLNPGGALLVVDLAKQEGGHTDAVHGTHEHGHDHTHHHSIPQEFHHLVPHRGGLDEADMQKAFEGAGFESFSFENGLTAKNDAKLFLAKGIKPVV